MNMIMTDILIACLFSAAFFGAQQLTNNEPPTQLVEADQDLMQCLPVDTGSRVIMTLASDGEVLTLRCEHHQKSEYGRAITEKPRYVSLTVPVDVN